MGVEKDIIVAVELGSTSIRAIAGTKQLDGNMQVTAFAEERSVNAIRKGTIDNIDKTTQAISNVVRKVGDQLGVAIARVYVGLGGQSMHAERNVISKTFPEKTKITNVVVDEMWDINSNSEYANSNILEVIPQEFRIGRRIVSEPVGMQSDQLEIDFLNVVARRDLKENIEICVRNAGLELVEVLNAPLCLADCQLSSSERHSGCALVNIGGDTTTVSVYKNDILRHLTVIPLGASHVTADIESLNIEAEEAESLKRRFGAAYAEEADTAGQPISISYNRRVLDTDIRNYSAARYEEIIMNIGEQLKGRDDLISGIVLTGGGAQIANIEEAFRQYIKWRGNIAIRKGLPTNVELAPNATLPEVCLLHTLIALLQKGDQNCASPMEETTIEPEPEEEISAPTEEEGQDATNETPEPEAEVEKPKKPKGPGIGSRLKKFLNEILTAEEED